MKFVKNRQNRVDHFLLFCYWFRRRRKVEETAPKTKKKKNSRVQCAQQSRNWIPRLPTSCKSLLGGIKMVQQVKKNSSARSAPHSTLPLRRTVSASSTANAQKLRGYSAICQMHDPLEKLNFWICIEQIVWWMERAWRANARCRSTNHSDSSACVIQATTVHAVNITIRASYRHVSTVPLVSTRRMVLSTAIAPKDSKDIYALQYPDVRCHVWTTDRVPCIINF